MDTPSAEKMERDLDDPTSQAASLLPKLGGYSALENCWAGWADRRATPCNSRLQLGPFLPFAGRKRSTGVIGRRQVRTEHVLIPGSEAADSLATLPPACLDVGVLGMPEPFSQKRIGHPLTQHYARVCPRHARSVCGRH